MIIAKVLFRLNQDASIIFEETQTLFPFLLHNYRHQFLVNEGEYKLMALAAFGKPVFADVMLNATPTKGTALNLI